MRKKVWSYFKIIVSASAVLAACIASLFLIPFRANADGETITDDYIVKRSLYQGLSSCYQNSLASSIAVDSSGYSTRVDAIFSKDTPHLYLPTGFGSKSEYACKRKDAGFVTSAVPSLMSSLASSVSLGTAEARDKYFEGMGFVGSNSNGDTASGEDQILMVTLRAGSDAFGMSLATVASAMPSQIRSVSPREKTERFSAFLMKAAQIIRAAILASLSQSALRAETMPAV